MSQQIQITGGAKVRNLEGVLTGTAGVVNALGINVPSGIPQLDGSGKILVSQLPNSVMEYKGTWKSSYLFWYYMAKSWWINRNCYKCGGY